MLEKTCVLALLLMAAACSRPGSPDVSGESHWLMACSDDGECGAGNLSCVCGTCTRACSNDYGCRGGACYDTDSPLLLQRCEARELQGAGVCLASCQRDAECGDTRSCVEGACVADEFAGVDAAVSWSEPVREPVTTWTVEGDALDLLGTWRESDCDPMFPTYGQGCLSIVLERDSAGNVQGHIQFDRTDPPFRPFAPAVDRSRGYPVELNPRDYLSLAVGATGFAFSLLNGRISGDGLNFDWNPYELWRDWCELQTPEAWHVGARTFYFCVPQDQTQWSELDPGKVVLCRSADMMEYCNNSFGENVPCVCLDPSDPMCRTNFCSCSASNCGMRMYNERALLSLSADKQTAFLAFDESPVLSEHKTRLTKVTP